MKKVKRLPRWMTDDECKLLIKWIDQLEIQEVAELKEWWENKRPGLLKRMIRKLAE